MTTTPQKASERRDGPRIDLRLRVRWSSPTANGLVSGEAEASDVSPKGLRLESEHQVDNGAALDLVVDVGGEHDELVAAGRVMWCRPRESPTGRQLFDVGVAFESDWLSKDRGPLGQALARIFSMNSYEPARTFERTVVNAVVDGSGAFAGGTLTMVNLSVGGMQLQSTASIADLRTGMDVGVELDAEGTLRTLNGRIAWVATTADAGDRFGLELAALTDDDKALLERLRAGQSDPVRVSLVLKV